MGMMYMPGAAPEGPYYFGGDYPFGTRLRINYTAARYVLAKRWGALAAGLGRELCATRASAICTSSRLPLVLR